jgi:tetratricopeptide (TPR) repeat protein
VSIVLRNRALITACALLTVACTSPDRASAQPRATDATKHIIALADSGKLEEAERVARGGGPGTLAMLGEVLMLRGKLAGADSAYRASIAAGAPGMRTAQVGLAELADLHGNRSDALRRAREITTVYEEGSDNWNAYDRVAAGRAYVLLGITDKQAVRNALAAFDKALVADPGNLEGRLRAGDLFLDKYNGPDAKASYDDALKLAPENSRALLGLARVAQFAGGKDAGSLVRRSIAANPELTPALLFLARAHLEAEAYDSARIVTRQALAVDSAAMTAWALLGANAYLTGDSTEYRVALAAATKINPKPAEFYVELAEAAVRQRRYSDGVRLANQALTLDSLSTRALGIVGTNQLREAKMDEGRATLEKAFAIDPFNLWHKNTLDLLDQLKTFKTTDKGHFRIVAPPNESDLLTLYLFPLLEEAYDSLSTRYNYKPAGPVRIEIYRQHADFSVRSVGLTGLGALGVSFGPVLAMDAPSARARGDFNWGATAWHELAHTFTLGASGNRVPRWLTEGLSMMEERRARSTWGFDETVEFFEAYQQGKLRPVSQLNDGFVRPRFEAETIFSYDLASLVCEMIFEQKGQAAINAMLNAYKDGMETPEVFVKVLKTSPAEFDKQFDAYMQKRYALPLAAVAQKGSAPSAFVAASLAASEMAQRGKTDSAVALYLRAKALFPTYAGPNGPNWKLANIEIQRGNFKAALPLLAEITAHNGTAWDANLLEADLREKLSDTTGMMRALERMIWISPYDAGLHARLAVASTNTKDFKRAVVERRAILALDPANKLDAQYDLAKALIDAGELAEARRTLLGVLEQAPQFEKAQSLLLELRNKSAPPH